MNQAEYRNWQLDSDMDGVCWLTLDREGETANSLSQDVLTELESIVDRLEKSPPKGLVLQSGKHGSFIVGADVREFDQVSSIEEAEGFIRSVHDLFDRVEALAFPKAVIIDGFCLGGGLELALCFDYRIARDNDKTRLGFPEVKLGIYPGFGGSARTTRLIGGYKALPLMLTARMLRARQARGMGLVDQLVGPHGSLRWAARNAVLKGRKTRGPRRTDRLTNTGPARKFLAGQMRKQTAAKANPAHYPAPFEMIDAWEEHGDDFREMLNQEAVRVARLITGDTSRGLRRVFWLMENLKSRGKGVDIDPRRVHVIGAGVMGGDIAAWCVLQGMEVTLQDREMKYIEPALARAGKLFKRRLKSSDRIAGAKGRLIADVAGDGVARADVIIEAIFENLEAKQELFRKLEATARPDALLASNTSAIPLREIASVLERPNRLVGLHFFNPVYKMPLVEIVYEEDTDPAEIQRVAAFGNRINRFPLLVKSSPGFLVNRVLGAYMLQAFRIHRERDVPKEAIDKAMENFGMPMGPVELADTVGLDVGMNVLDTLGGKDASAESGLLKSYVDQGKLGKKSGEGFYTWEKGKAVKDKEAAEGVNLKSLAKELMQPYFDECEACLADGIVEDADAVDAGMVFGTGFAPFRGGPMFYLENRGEQES
ncbi:MAG: enoyl-CoA hydratase/isomerase family protein [Gammaproteobacteria bacterium]|nr:enoyl-CoA hydratase/isomerase family protein [Gammaproteobacteria bacterium]